MFSLFDQLNRPNSEPTRRELLRVGGLSLLGLGAADLARLRAASAATATTETRRRNACVFLFLFGGPSHSDLWDMKPLAPAEVRGVFTPTATAVPGIRICEHLPRLGRVMDKICLLRSMTHRMNVHGPACSEVFSGREYFGPPITDEANREDWPSLSALTMRYGKPHAGLPPSVGQSLLLARRLVEAGVSLITVNWQDETKIDGVNTCWDTHQNNFAKLKDLLCPLFDQAFPAFVEDLHARGLLDTTLVVALGEFGRTPKLGQFTQSSNTQKSGRDHWPHGFTALLAGGGVRGGQVYGASTD